MSFFYVHVTRKSCQNATFVRIFRTFNVDEIDTWSSIPFPGPPISYFPRSFILFFILSISIYLLSHFHTSLYFHLYLSLSKFSCSHSFYSYIFFTILQTIFYLSLLLTCLPSYFHISSLSLCIYFSLSFILHFLSIFIFFFFFLLLFNSISIVILGGAFLYVKLVLFVWHYFLQFVQSLFEYPFFWCCSIEKP